MSWDTPETVGESSGSLPVVTSVTLNVLFASFTRGETHPSQEIDIFEGEQPDLADFAATHGEVAQDEVRAAVARGEDPGDAVRFQIELAYATAWSAIKRQLEANQLDVTFGLPAPRAAS